MALKAEIKVREVMNEQLFVTVTITSPFGLFGWRLFVGTLLIRLAGWIIGGNWHINTATEIDTNKELNGAR